MYTIIINSKYKRSIRQHKSLTVVNINYMTCFNLTSITALKNKATPKSNLFKTFINWFRMTCLLLTGYPLKVSSATRRGRNIRLIHFFLLISRFLPKIESFYLRVYLSPCDRPQQYRIIGKEIFSLLNFISFSTYNAYFMFIILSFI